MELISNYKPLFINPPKTRYFLVTGGRGSAKSFHVSTMLLNLTYEAGHIILFTRWTMVSTHISIIPEFIEKIERLNKFDDFIINQTEIVNKRTGSKIIFRGIKTSQGTATANLKSISGVTTWVLDEAEELHDQDVFDKINLSIRTKNTPNRVILIMNPSFRSHWIYEEWFRKKREDTTYIHTSYLDNYHNLDKSFLDEAERIKSSNIIRYNHLFLGDWLDDAEGLLWNMALINRQRVSVKPEFKRVVVSLDPASTANKKSDETGITVEGIDFNGNGYFLEDRSGIYTPNEWGSVACQLADKWNADCIVAEKNQGGDMVEYVIRQINKRIRVKLVHATKGKYTRAEPIFSLYEQGKIFHLGYHTILERQMVTFNPDETEESPDRVDAMVWGFTELFPIKKQSSWGVIGGK